LHLNNGKEKEVLLGVSFDEVEGIKNVGDASQPSLEKILLLKPDLILTTDYSNADQKYNLLSAIAPTVPVFTQEDIPSINWENKPYFQENLRYIAKIIGQETKAEEVLSQYQKRIEELQKRLGNHLEQIEISVIFYGEGYIWTIAKGIYPISYILDDVGLRYKFVPHGKVKRVSIYIAFKVSECISPVATVLKVKRSHFGGLIGYAIAFFISNIVRSLFSSPT
jgi:iron complex transport system substrate-binding protein